MKLLASPISPYTRKVRVVLAEKKIECEMEYVDVGPVENPVNRMNPLGKVPTLVLEDGTALYDAGLLVRYESLRDKPEQSAAWQAKQVARMHRGMALAEAELEGHTWCHGDRYSLADIALGCCLGWVDFRKPGDVDWHGSYPALARHYRKLLERAAFADTIPK
jgi:glutathione S-transferase